MKTLNIAGFRNLIHKTTEGIKGKMKRKTTRPFAAVAGAVVLAAALAGCGDDEGYVELKRTIADQLVAAPRNNGSTQDKSDRIEMLLGHQKPRAVFCNKVKPDSTTLQIGDRFTIRLTRSDGYGIEITNVSKDRITADIIFPVEFPLPVNVVTITFTLRYNEIPRNQVEALFAVCSDPAKGARTVHNEEPAYLLFSDALNTVKTAVRRAGFDTYGEVILFQTMPGFRLMHAKVIEEHAEEIVLDVDKKKVTLARNAGMHMRFMTEDGRNNVFELPLRLTADGSLIKAVIDCNPDAKIRYGMHTPESSNGEARATPFCTK